MTLESRLVMFQPAERATLQWRRSHDGFTAMALIQLERIIGSRTFARAQDLTRDLLVFLVGFKLLGLEERIKQLTIARRVFHDHDFDPLDTSRIRMAAASLRQRLRAFYAGEGVDDIIKITIPLGRYAPVITSDCTHVVVQRFAHWGPRADRALGLGVFEEISRILTLDRHISVSRRINRFGRNGPQYVLRGATETSAAAVRIHVSMFHREIDAIVFSQVFEAGRNDALSVAGQIVAALVAGLRAQRGG